MMTKRKYPLISRSALRSGAWLLLGVAVPGFLALYYVYRFGVNLPIHDEWSFMPVVEAFYSRGDWLRLVLEHYGEHRIVVPKLVILFLSTWTDLDVKVEIYLSALLMTATAAVCWVLLRRRQDAPRWLIVPIGLLLTSWGQFANLLVGWQFQIPLMNVLAVTAIAVITAERITTGRFALAALAAFVATFCFANGMLIWPSVLAVLLLRKPRTPWIITAWTGAMVVSVILYRWGYAGFDRLPKGYETAILKDPGGGTSLLLAMLGNNLGAGTLRESMIAGAVLAVVLLAAMGYLLTRLPRPIGRKETRLKTRAVGRWLRFARDPQGRLLGEPWVMLFLFSLLSALSIAIGRGHNWQAAATRSQYLTITVFVPVAALVLVAMALRRMRRARPTAARWATTIAAILLLAGVLQLYRTMRVGWAVAEANRRLKVEAIPCVLHYRTASVECLERLYAHGGERVRERAATLDRYSLGPFANASELGAQDLAVRGGFDLVSAPGPDPNRQAEAGAPVLRLGETLAVAGWALQDDLTAVPAVILAVDGEWRAVTSRFLPRPDVVRHFRRGYPLPPSGWHIEWPVAALEPGRHTAEILLLPDDSSSPVPLGVQKYFQVLPPSEPVAASDGALPGPLP